MSVAFEKKKFKREGSIKDAEYGLHVLGARRAFMYGLEIRKLLPAGGSFLDAQATDALDGMKFQTIAQAVMDNFDLLDVEGLLESIVWENITYNGQAIDNVDEHFRGNLGEMLDVVIWAMEVNFSSLFMGSIYLSKILNKLKVSGLFPKVQEVSEETLEEEVLESE